MAALRVRDNARTEQLHTHGELPATPLSLDATKIARLDIQQCVASAAPSTSTHMPRDQGGRGYRQGQRYRRASWTAKRVGEKWAARSGTWPVARYSETTSAVTGVSSTPSR
jgi:hypothetical protein